MQTLQALQERRLKFWTSKFLYILRNAFKIVGISAFNGSIRKEKGVTCFLGEASV